MDHDPWWELVARARASVGAAAENRDDPDDPLPGALLDLLVALPAEQVVELALAHAEIADSAYRYPLWHAAYLIEGGCGDDAFMDFRDGLMLLGRDRFTRAVADPDSLADHPTVITMARDDEGWIGYESLSYLLREAHKRLRGDADALDTALRSRAAVEEPAGPECDPDDEEDGKRHLPALTTLFLDT